MTRLAAVGLGCLAAMAIRSTLARAGGPAFEKVSIEPSRSAEGSTRMGLQPGGRLTATHATLRDLVRFAYKRHAFDQLEVAGGPAWADSDRFDVAAKVSGEHVFDTDGLPRRTWSMLQGALAERFKLKVHTETKTVPIYALVAATPEATSGPRLHKSNVDCGAVMRDMFAAPRRPDETTVPVCAHARYPRRLVANSITMTDLAGVLSPLLGRTVVDQTKLGGPFDLELEAVEITPSPIQGPSSRPSDTNRSIFETLPEQLGLKLEATTGPVELVVIDHAERPAGRRP